MNQDFHINEIKKDEAFGQGAGAGYGTYRENYPEYEAKEFSYEESDASKEKSKGEKIKKGKHVLNKFLGGIVFGTAAALSFLAVKEIGGVLGGGESVYLPKEEEIAEASEDTEEVIVYPVSNSGQQHTVTTVVTDVTDVVADVMPSVVSITNQYTDNYYYYTGQEGTSGSGIIIGSNEEELLVVTNYHVIEGYDSLQVCFVNGEEVPANVKGTDVNMDLAVLAVRLEEISEETEESIEIARMGYSESLQIGEPVIAIGNALGYGQSVTTGVVSAVNREFESGGIEGTFIQTDAAINPGNSGGALLNIAGEVIGINSNKIGGSIVEGMGYAIPISAARPIIEELMLQETRQQVAEAERSYLGISGANISDQEAAFYGYPEGVYVANIFEGTGAAESGLQVGDFIVAFDGEPIRTMEQLQNILQYYPAETKVELQVMRQNSKGYVEIIIEVTLSNWNDFN